MALTQIYDISTIEHAPASCGGGLYVNGQTYVDAGFTFKINFTDQSITISSPKSEDIYVGVIGDIHFGGVKKQPRSLEELVNWFKPGHAEQGGDDGFSVAISFDPYYFSGDGSDLHPVTIRKGVVEPNVSSTDYFSGEGWSESPLNLVRLSSALVMAQLDPAQFYIGTDGLIHSITTPGPGPTPVTDEVYARRFILSRDSSYPEIKAKRFILTKDQSYPEVTASKFTLVKQL